MKLHRFWMLLTFSFLLLLAACSGDENATSEKNEAATNETTEKTDAQGGELVIEVLSEAVELDPHGSNDIPSSNIQRNIFETLVVRNFETGEIEPLLAESWEYVDDLTLQLKLRQGVKFHDGTEFNAEAVKVNLDRLLDPNIASPRLSNFEPISEIVVVDDYTVQIKTEKPYGPLLFALTHPGGNIMSPAVIEEDYKRMENGGEARAYGNENPIGTGFLKLEKWSPGQEIRLVKNTEYWGEQVAYDSAVFKTVPESATRAADLEAGYAHIIDPVQPTEVPLVEGFAQVLKQPSVSISYLGFNTEKAPFDNPKVRQAITKALDREAIIKGVFDDFGVQAFGPLSPMVWGYTEDVTKQDTNLEEAKALLAEAGFADGFKTAIWTNDNPQRQQIAIILQEALKQLKVEATIEVMEWGAYLEKTSKGDHDMFMLGWAPSTGDADGALYPLFHSSDIGNNNRTRYSNAKLDELLELGRIETDEAVRADIYKEVQEMINTEAPAAFIHHQAYLTGYANNVTGLSVDATGIYQIQNVQINQ
ncbi:glutathione ABC transporter substrate-binding protein [Solibacillus sp. A46]|uniref:Glutathione ABC transporter substrate-binding protein n=1 Tax=Solibacillus faecavium TaxID=2762221 RepID=A0ABR8Y2D6_9BACL|nr:glutathione ABC transporter substrate-binding protein [Solibacillus faecavium]MBD8038359.1 glutathione ABC transporter substrate-binding protein [Solibacillus faecavium]